MSGAGTAGDVSPAASVPFSYTECDNYNNSDKLPMIPIINYQRLYVGLRRPSYSRSSYHQILRNILYLCISLTLILFIWLAFYISDSSWINHISTSSRDHMQSVVYRKNIAAIPTTAISNNVVSSYHVYGVVFDAGSTGSRVHIFKLLYNPLDHFKPYTLIDDIFDQVKPGLSAYAEKPDDAANSLTKLINTAEKSLPPDTCHNTPVMLRATAGLRLLSIVKAENILKAVRSRLSKTCFKQLSNGVTIMDGFYEGLYLWITLNFLNDRLSQRKMNVMVTGDDKQNSLVQQQTTIGTLDLGGGSTQITFIPTELNTIKNSPIGYITNFSPNGKENKDFQEKIYSHSYLGLGLMSARYSMLHTATGYVSVQSSQPPDGKKQFFYPCWPNNITITWNHAGYDWEIGQMNQSMMMTPHLLSSLMMTMTVMTKSSDKQISTELMNNSYLSVCYALALSVLQNPVEGDGNTTRYPPNNFIVHQPDEVKTREFYAFSYYFDLAVSAGLIDEDNGGFLTVGDFYKAAKLVCQNPDPKKPFDCMDLNFVTALLHNGYGFPWDKKIGFFRKVKSFEINWSLGALFSEMYN
ncbi:unnamed protein product [Trichobilharzia szidati]|nr:unnamed protein product [Trichobilharzia szidati]